MVLIIVDVKVVVVFGSLPPEGAGVIAPAPPSGPCFGAVIVTVLYMVEVSLMVEVMVVVEPPITLVNVIVLSKTEVDAPVLDSAAGVEVTLMFSPPLGPTFVTLLWDHSDHVLSWLGTLVVSPETAVPLVIVADQSDHVLLTSGIVEVVEDSTGFVVVPSVADTVVDSVVVVVVCPSMVVE